MNRKLTRRTAVAVLLSLSFAASAAHAQTAPKPRAVTRPISSITVKVMPEERFHGKSQHWLISAVSGTSCTAWVDAAVVQREKAELTAYAACRRALAAVRSAVCTEDMPCWDCKTMGNRVCGPKSGR